jgi:two-component system, NtrC family, sensor kinase
VQVGAPPAVVEAQKIQGGPVPGSLLDRVMKTKQVDYTADAMADPFPGLAAKFAGARSIVGAPMTAARHFTYQLVMSPRSRERC